MEESRGLRHAIIAVDEYNFDQSATALVPFVEAPQRSNPIKDFLDGQRTEATRIAYRGDIARFVRWLLVQEGQPTLYEATARLVTAFRNADHALGLANNTINRRLTTLTVLYEYLIAEGVVTVNPASHVKHYPVASESPRTPLAEFEVRALLDQPDRETFTGLRDYTMMLLMLRLGLRAATAANLPIGALGMEGGYHTLYVVSKGGKDKRFPLPVDVAQALNAYLVADNREWVWQHITGEGADMPVFPALKRDGKPYTPRRPVSYKQVWRAVVHYGACAGLTIDVHTLRVTFATNVIDHGGDLLDLMEAMMHSKAETTQGYVRRRRSLASSVVHLVQYGGEG